MKKVGLVVLAGLAFLPSTVYATDSGSEAFTDIGEQISYIPEEVSPFARAVETENIGGGTWKRGTSLTITGRKKVVSEFRHTSKQSRASVEIDGRVSYSGADKDDWTARGVWAKSSITGNRNSMGYAFYATQ